MSAQAQGAETRVSVVIPAFDVGRFIAETLDSVLAQTHPAAEIIVVDDGSRDDTAEVVRRYGGHVRLFSQRNAGAGAARNRGARAASGDYLVFLDGDDVLEVHALERQLALAARFPDSGLVAGDGVKFDEQRVLATTLLHVPLHGTNPRDRDDGTVHGRFYVETIRYNPITTPGQVLIPRTVFEGVGGFVEARCWYSEDWDLWIRIARSHPITLHATPVMRYRHRQTSISGVDDERSIRWAIGGAAVARRHLRVCRPEAREVVRDKLAMLVAEGSNEAYYLGRRGQRTRGLAYLARMWSKAPRSVLPPVRLVALAMPEKLLGSCLGIVRRLLRRST